MKTTKIEHNGFAYLVSEEKVTQHGIWAYCNFSGSISKTRNGQHNYKIVASTNPKIIADGIPPIIDSSEVEESKPDSKKVFSRLMLEIAETDSNDAGVEHPTLNQYDYDQIESDIQNGKFDCKVESNTIPSLPKEQKVFNPPLPPNNNNVA